MLHIEIIPGMAAAYFSWAALISCQVVFSRRMCPLSVPFWINDSYVLISAMRRSKRASKQAEGILKHNYLGSRLMMLQKDEHCMLSADPEPTSKSSLLCLV